MWKAACLAIFLLLAAPQATRAQAPYFPPNPGSGTWQTVDPASLGWCPSRIDSLVAFLEARNTKGFLVLKDGRIALEHYFGSFTQDSLWYWASAGKVLVATTVGAAQEDGFLNILDPVSNYLGPGWTSAAPAQEAAITVRHQLTMTTGLDDGVPNSECTAPDCLPFLAEAGTRWAYHNAPYTLLRQVVANATGQLFLTYFNNRLRNRIGMNGLWLPVGDNVLYFSNLRSMARFGLLAMNGMVWGTDTILHDTAFVHAATNPSQTLNPSYGYLWWLNGQSTFMLPGLQISFPGPLMPDAPMNMFSGLGMNDQIMNVVPGAGLVLVRMGGPAGDTYPVSALFDNEIWQYMNALECGTGIAEASGAEGALLVPNPASGTVRIGLHNGGLPDRVVIMDSCGRTLHSFGPTDNFDVAGWPPGVYFVRVISPQGTRVVKLMVE